jgi:hypothetical protein
MLKGARPESGRGGRMRRRAVRRDGEVSGEVSVARARSAAERPARGSRQTRSMRPDKNGWRSRELISQREAKPFNVSWTSFRPERNRRWRKATRTKTKRHCAPARDAQTGSENRLGADRIDKADRFRLDSGIQIRRPRACTCRAVAPLNRFGGFKESRGCAAVARKGRSQRNFVLP